MYLNTHSWFSLRYGVMRPEELLAEAQAAGVTCMALTDVHGTSGGPDFVRLAAKYGIRPVLGVDFRQGATPTIHRPGSGPRWLRAAVFLSVRWASRRTFWQATSHAQSAPCPPWRGLGLSMGAQNRAQHVDSPQHFARR